MPTRADLDAMQLYKSIMEEIKWRLLSINAGLDDSGQFPPALKLEFGYLQLRMICELVAHACLVAHGDITASAAKSLTKKWQADQILKQLSALHPQFFPQPLSPPESRGPNLWHYGKGPTDHMTKVELIALYSRCGDHLHKGSLRRLKSVSSRSTISFDFITEQAQRLSNLLNIHVTSRIGREFHFVATLVTGVADAAVQVFIAEKTANSARQEAAFRPATGEDRR